MYERNVFRPLRRVESSSKTRLGVCVMLRALMSGCDIERVRIRARPDSEEARLELMVGTEVAR